MEVANLLGGIKVIIGLDLFGLLGYKLKNAPILFPKNKEIDINMDKKNQRKRCGDFSLTESIWDW